MRQIQLGKTGIRVAAMGLGAMPLSLAGRPDEAQALKVIKTFTDLGGDFIDTANVYCQDDTDIGHNEQLITKALQQLGKTSAVTVATKGGLRRPKGNWVTDGNPAFIRRSCAASLQALGCDCINLYQLHAVDAKTGVLSSLQVLLELQQEGKIRHIGLSNVTQAQVETALQHTDIVSVQNRCNLLEQRDFANGLVDWCGRQSITFIPHSPVGGHYGHVALARHPLLMKLAKKYDATPYQIALAWLLAKGEHILPIPGASKPESIASSWGALALNLEPADVAAIDIL